MSVKIPQKLFYRLHQAFCYLLLISILIYVSCLYLKYGTDTKVAPYTPIRQQLPRVSLCFDMSTLLFKNITNKYFYSNYPPFASLTTDVMFENAPPASSLLNQCSYRMFNIDTFWMNTNSTECTGLFNIKRYRMGGYMCYKLQFSPTDYSFYLITNSMSEQRKLFRFDLRYPFDQGHVVLPIVHFTELPYYERLFSLEVAPYRTTGSYTISYHLYEIFKLPPPYNTRCSRGVSNNQCYDVCRDQKYAKLNYTNLYGILPEEQATKNLKVAYFETAEPKIMKAFDLISSKCTAKCKRDSCKLEMSITHLSQVRNSSTMNFITETAHFPVTKVLHVPRFQFADYCLQCFSWAGIVIGFSIVSIMTIRLSKCEESATMHKAMKIELDINKLANLLLRRGFFRNKKAQTIIPRMRPGRKAKSGFAHFSVYYTIVTFLVLLWQLTNIITNFFLFETTWKFLYEIGDNFILPSTAICLSLTDLFKVGGTDLNASNYHPILLERDKQLNFTLEEIFSKTPGEEILSKCRFRNWTQYHLGINLHNRNECFKIFSMRKSLTGGKMCYFFAPHEKRVDLSHSRVALSPINPGVIYSLIPGFDKIPNTFIELVVYIGNETPSTSKKHAVLVHGSANKRMQFISYHLYHLKLLPAPYDTQCSNFANYTACRRNCYLGSVKKFNRLIIDEMYSSPSNDRLIQYSDLINRTVNEYLVSLEERCYKKCKGASTCEYKYTSTELGNSAKKSEFDFELLITTSQNLIAKQVAIARVTFYDLFYQILCSFAFWLGFSILSFNTFKQIDPEIVKLKHELVILMNRAIYLFTLLAERGILLSRIEHNNWKVRLKKALPKFICVFGCIIHISCSLEYFTYPIILDTTRKLDTETSYTLTVCVDARQFFASKEPLGRGWKEKSFDYNMLQSELLNMTNSEMFINSPREKDILVLCRVWGGVDERRTVNDLSVPSDRIMLIETNSTRCYKYFEVKKRVTQTKICYSSTPKVKLDWNRDQLANVLDIGLSGYFYMIAINSSLIGKKFSVFATSANSPLGYSSIWSSYVGEHYKFSRWHIVSYTKYMQNALPPPYSDGGFAHMSHVKCMDTCINYQLAPLNKSLNSIFHIPSNRRLVTYADRVLNKTFNNWINEKLEQCEQECRTKKLSESQMEFTVTEITKGVQSRSSTFQGRPVMLTSFYLRTSDNPVVVISFKAQISFFEFIITLGSIISIWFGLSVRTIPRSVLRYRHNSDAELIDEMQSKIQLLNQFVKNL